jgi:hypothetical protein
MREIARRGLTATSRATRNLSVEKRRAVMSTSFQPPVNDQAEEQARFVVTQHLNCGGGIDHDTLLMRDSRSSWSAILVWINGSERPGLGN